MSDTKLTMKYLYNNNNIIGPYKLYNNYLEKESSFKFHKENKFYEKSNFLL